MLKKILLLKIFVAFSINAIAATSGYVPVEEEGVAAYRGSLSIISSWWDGWTKPHEAPVVAPEFRPISRELTIEEQRAICQTVTAGTLYLVGTDKRYPKNIQEGLNLLNIAAQLGQGDACYELARYFRRGQYGLPIDLGLAAAYERNAKWFSPGKPFVPPSPPAPVTEAGKTEDRRPSGDSDGPTAAAASGGVDSAPGLRHRTHAAGGAGEA